MQKNLLIFLCYFLKRVLLNLNTDTYVCNEAQFLATIHRSDRLTIYLRLWCSVRTHTHMCRQCYAWCSLFRQCSFPEWWDRGMELPNKDSKFLKWGKEDRGNVVRKHEYIRQFWQKKSEFTELELKQPDEHFSTQTPKRLKLRWFLTIALRILSAHILWRHLAPPRARAH